jgi:Tol biopolymer transport system component
MTDIRERLRAFDHLQFEDRWAQIERQPANSSAARQSPSPIRRVLTAAVALAVAIASLLYLSEAFHRTKTTRGHSPSPQATVVSNGLIAFSGRNGVIWTVEPDGRHLTELSGAPTFVQAIGPVFSPDGTQIAFYGYPKTGPVGGGANYDVYMMNVDGSGIVNLTTSPSDISSRSSQTTPQWSPDGTNLLYSGDDGLYVMNADGSQATKVADAYSGVWSPDGSRIAYTGKGRSIYTVGVDGTNVTQLTQAPTGTWDQTPSWSRDGSRIAFFRSVDQSNALYSVNADGTELLLISKLGEMQTGYTALWSPDDKTVVFDGLEKPSNQWDLFSVPSDGGDVTNLTSTPNADESGAVWSPDGTQLAFARSTVVASNVDNTGSFDVYTMKPDGSDVHRVTTDAGARGYDTAWQPVPVEATDAPTVVAPASFHPTIAAHFNVGPRGQTEAITTGAGSVWVAAYGVQGGAGVDQGALLRIDPATDAVAQTIPVRAFPSFETGGGGLVFADGSVWVIGTDRAPGSPVSQAHALLQRVDPATGQVQAIPLGGHGGIDVSANSSGIWALISGTGTIHAELVHLDPATNLVLSRTPIPAAQPRRLVASSDAIVVEDHEWPPNGVGPCVSLEVFDASTGVLRSSRPLTTPCGYGTVIGGFGATWVSGEGLSKIDLTTGEPEGVGFPYGGHAPRGFIVPANSGFWYAAYPGRNGNGGDLPSRLDPVTGDITNYSPTTGFLSLRDSQAITAAASGNTLWLLGFDGTVTRIDLRPSSV